VSADSDSSSRRVSPENSSSGAARSRSPAAEAGTPRLANPNQRFGQRPEVIARRSAGQRPRRIVAEAPTGTAAHPTRRICRLPAMPSSVKRWQPRSLTSAPSIDQQLELELAGDQRRVEMARHPCGNRVHAEQSGTPGSASDFPSAPRLKRLHLRRRHAPARASPAKDDLAGRCGLLQDAAATSPHRRSPSFLPLPASTGPGVDARCGGSAAPPRPSAVRGQTIADLDRARTARRRRLLHPRNDQTPSPHRR